ncbi:restriction endonuclease [Micromonospora citrea]|uniref:restriction endonuclease n=1 Tax=Micromonospora citrea TaxID=47855 RepID=UPI003C6AAA90
MNHPRSGPSTEVRPWAERSNTIGILPGRKENRLETLRYIFSHLPAAPGSTIPVTMASGVQVDATVEDLFGKQLSRGALVRRDSKGNWVAVEVVAHWLETSDNDALADYLHANVKLFGELLNELSGIQSKGDLLEIPNRYGLPWSSSDQVHRRIGWMTSLGLVERWDNRYVVTPRGHAFLDRIRICSADEAVGASSNDETIEVELPEAGEVVSTLTGALSSQALAKRRALIGYIPRGRKAPERDEGAGSQSPLDAVRILVDIVGAGSSTEELFERFSTQLGMKKSSISQTLQTLKNMRAIEMVAFNQYGTREDFAELVEFGQEIDLVRFLHTRYKFVGELLTHLEEATAVSELVRTANSLYRCTQIDNYEVRTRLGFMVEAGLVERIDWTRYRITALGRLLAKDLPLESPTWRDDPESESTTEEVEAPPATASVDSLTASLRNYSNRGDASTEFEATVADAFRFLGFQAEHLGGSGRTDVVITAELPAADRYRSIVETKSSASGIITDNLIKFDALKDHQKKHRTDYGMVVGPDFSTRVREWATNNNFTLLTVEDLIGLLSRHERYPLTLVELRLLFERTGDDLADIEEQYGAAERTADLLAKLIELLHNEANEDDPLMNGFISNENIHYALRKEMNPRPSASSIEECLQFLSHEFVRGAIKSGSKYKLTDAPSNIMRRLSGLGIKVGGLTPDAP